MRIASCSNSHIDTVDRCCRSLKMKLIGGKRTFPLPPPPPPRPVIVFLDVNMWGRLNTGGKVSLIVIQVAEFRVEKCFACICTLFRCSYLTSAIAGRIRHSFLLYQINYNSIIRIWFLINSSHINTFNLPPFFNSPDVAVIPMCISPVDVLASCLTRN